VSLFFLQEETASKVIRMTRINSHSHRSPGESRQTVSSMKEINTSAADPNVSTIVLCNDNMKTLPTQESKKDVDQPQFSHSTTEKDSVLSTIQVTTSLISSSMEQTRVISTLLLDN